MKFEPGLYEPILVFIKEKLPSIEPFKTIS